MKAKEIVLLILIALVGVGFHYLQNFRVSIDDWNADFLFRGNSYTFEESLTLEPAALIEVINSHGQVECEGSDRPDIALTFEKKVWRKDEETARKTADEIKLLTTRDGDRLILTTNRDTFKKRNFNTSFRLLVPRNVSVKLTNSHGPVRISRVNEAEVDNRHGRVDVLEIQGRVKAVNSFENLSLMDIGGECLVETKHSSLIMSRISGPVKLDCAYEEVELFDLRGTLDLTSRHTRIKAVRLAGPSEISGSYELISLTESGPATIKGHHCSVEIDNLTGILQVETTYEQIKLDRIEGNVMIRGKSTEVSLDSVKAQKINIETSYEDVRLENFTGELQLTLAHGDVSLNPINLDFPITVQNEYSNLKFYWPENQTARFEAKTISGNISWQLPVTPEENITNGTAILRAFTSAQDRPEIKLGTTYGDIRVLKKE
jgi:hypothetical protein